MSKNIVSGAVALMMVVMPVSASALSQSSSFTMPTIPQNASIQQLLDFITQLQSILQRLIAEQIPPTHPINCPVYNIAICAPGEHLVGGGTLPNGCQAAPRCVPDSSTAALSASPMSGVAPLGVALIASNLSSSGKYSIDYGNGTTASICNQNSSGIANCGSSWTGSYTYTAPGSYTVKLIKDPESGAGNCWGVDCAVVARAYVSVTSSTDPADVFVSSPSSGSAPLAVRFFVYETPYSNLSIDFGDGTSAPVSPNELYDCRQDTRCARSVTSHTYAQAGVYTAKLRRGESSYEANCWGSECRVIAIETVSVTSGPTNSQISITAPSNGASYRVGDTIPVNYSYTGAPPNSQVIIKYENISPSYPMSGVVSGGSWQSGQTSYSGIGSYSWQTGPSMTDFTGTYRITAMIRECSQHGCWYADPTNTSLRTWATSQPVTITLNQSGANAILTAYPSAGPAPLSVTFTTNGRGSYIDFGDGTSGPIPTGGCTTVGLGICYVGNSVQHTYASAGTYVATLSDGAAGGCPPTASCSSMLPQLASATVRVMASEDAPRLTYTGQSAGAVTATYSDMPSNTQVILINQTTGVRVESVSTMIAGGGSGTMTLPFPDSLAAGTYYLRAQNYSTGAYVAQTVSFPLSRQTSCVAPTIVTPAAGYSLAISKAGQGQGIVTTGNPSLSITPLPWASLSGSSISFNSIPSAGTYSITITAINPCGAATRTFNVVVEKNPYTCPVYNQPLCPSGQHLVTDPSTIDADQCVVPHWRCISNTSPLGVCTYTVIKKTDSGGSITIGVPSAISIEGGQAACSSWCSSQAAEANVYYTCAYNGAQITMINRNAQLASALTAVQDAVKWLISFFKKQESPAADVSVSTTSAPQKWGPTAPTNTQPAAPTGTLHAVFKGTAIPDVMNVTKEIAQKLCRPDATCTWNGEPIVSEGYAPTPGGYTITFTMPAPASKQTLASGMGYTFEISDSSSMTGAVTQDSYRLYFAKYTSKDGPDVIYQAKLSGVNRTLSGAVQLKWDGMIINPDGSTAKLPAGFYYAGAVNAKNALKGGSTGSITVTQ